MIHTTFKRIAIINRAEPAMRLIHAVREINAEQNAGFVTLAFHTEPDANSMYVREADEAWLLGPAMFDDPRDHRRKNTYLNYAGLERALVDSRAEAAWVGWGFVAEHAEFADLCAGLGVVFIGPPSEAMRRLGDKIASKRLAEATHVPVAPWSNGPVENLAEARRHAERIGFPVMIKATAGGGGRGIRRVDRPDDLDEAFNRARSEALASFGDDTVFLEKKVSGARHVEVQVAADQDGTTWAVGVRDCSVQRRNQKVIEEAPSPAVSPQAAVGLCEAAARLAKAAQYRNVGTVEFLFETTTQSFCFMEMNTRLQVEHPVTELTTGVDLVKLQLHIAAGGRLQGPPPPTIGHAIEVRLNAEDPDNDFAPSPGRVQLFRIPCGPGLRVDTGISQGDSVPPEFDSMIAKIISFGATRQEALARLKRALHDSALVIENGTSNKSFLLDILGHSDFATNKIDTAWLDRLAAAMRPGERPHADIALLMAAVLAYQKELTHEQAVYLRTAARGRPQVREETGLQVELAREGHVYAFTVHCIDESRYHIHVDAAEIDVLIERHGPFEHSLWHAGHRFRVVAIERGGGYLIEVDGALQRVSRDEGGAVRSPSPALVVSIHVKEGDTISAGDRLMVLEAMKSEILVMAPVSGRIRQVLTHPNTQVQGGAPLLTIEPSQEREVGKASSRVGFRSESAAAHDASDPGQRCRGALKQLKQFVLGFDVAAREQAAALQEYQSTRQLVFGHDALIIEEENTVLATFADSMRLHSQAPVGEELLSPDECLRRLMRAGHHKGLPLEFVNRLGRALSHYGIQSLDDAVLPGAALLRLSKSYSRAFDMVAPIVSILEHRLQRIEKRHGFETKSFGALLDLLLDATHQRSFAVHDLALQLRFRLYYQPLYDELRARSYAELEGQIDALPTERVREHREAIVEKLVTSSLPILGLLTASVQRNPVAAPTVLEILVRRFYRESGLHGLQIAQLGKLVCLEARFVVSDQEKYLAAVLAHAHDLEEAVRAALTLFKRGAGNGDGVIDLFLLSPQQDLDVAEVRDKLLALLAGHKPDKALGRVCLTIMHPARFGAADYVTFGRRQSSYEEVEQYRGIHPMRAGSLGIWRLRGFNTTRLPSPEDIYLFHALGRTNPKDERLFVFIEVRDATPVKREETGELHMPHFEHKVLEALSCIRDFQYRRAPHMRLHWNRVIVGLAPAMRLTLDEIRAAMERLAPNTYNLGLEKLVVRAHFARTAEEPPRVKILNFWLGVDRVTRLQVMDPGEVPIHELTPYTQKVARLRARALNYPYEIIRMLTPQSETAEVIFPRGQFCEYDLNAAQELLPIERENGLNDANIVVGVIKNYTARYPEGLTRVMLLGDPSKEMGALAQPECRRIIAALDLAERMQVPVDWFPVSSGAKIAMDSGTENLDWTARVLRRIIEFTQGGREINVIIDGINVGAQSYWNAEATMLMHTRGILVMTPNAAMVLTGKQALEYSGSVAAEDNQGIGGVGQIMGPNGQAQYMALDLTEACAILFRHYEHTYIAPGESSPRRAQTTDAFDRDVSKSPYDGASDAGFVTVGDIFSMTANPQRKKSFSIRSVMKSVTDQDSAYLERWAMMRDAEVAVTWEARIGGISAMLIGVESRPLSRGGGFTPGDGPDVWTGGTLFPLSSKKVAHAINCASGNRPVVILANLSGFDGSPESLRRLQLEYGAEIGRAVVNFRGPLVFCVISRYHGGAYVVFSHALNDGLRAAAVEGSFASVIGGAPAAAVVFAREVDGRVYQHPDIKRLQGELRQADERSLPHVQASLGARLKEVRADVQRDMADQFDKIHTVERAKEVGSIHDILPARDLRPYVIRSLEQGLRAWTKATP